MRVSSGELIRKFSQFCDTALREPIIVTKNGRDRLVLISIDEYNHLRDLLQPDAALEVATESAGKLRRRAGDE